MSRQLVSLKELYNSYKTWVCENPETAGEVESVVKWLSYFIVGRVNDSNTLTELIYSVSNLFVLFNDIILHSYKKTFSCEDRSGKLKVCLTILEYSEVFIEISSRKLWGESGKWVVAILIQSFKYIIRILLLLQYKENVLSCPPIEPVKRSEVVTPAADDESNLELNGNSAISFTLKRSGKIIRKVNAAPSIHGRIWKPPKLIDDDDKKDKLMTKLMFCAEVVYISKPMAHLGALLHCGHDSWKPWLLSLAMDLTSLGLMYHKGITPKERLQSLSRRQRLELSRRSYALLLYLMRSPCYDRYSKDRVNALLDSLAANLPLARLLCNPIKQYIPYWQDKYFYLWSS